MSKPTLLIVTSKTCSACHSFKQKVYHELKGKLQRLNGINIGEVDLDTMSSPLPSVYPKEVRKFIGWYPTFVLLAPIRNGRVEGAVFNGKMNGERVSGPTNERPISADSIVQWVEQELRSNPIFTSAAQASFGARYPSQGHPSQGHPSSQASSYSQSYSSQSSQYPGYRGMIYRAGNH